MSLFDATIIQRFTREGEDIFNQEYPTIVDRLALDIVNGTAQYDLPEYVMSIRRVTWLGWKLDASTFRSLRDSGLKGTESATPTDYIFDNIGQLKIQFFPVPNVDIASTVSDLWGAEIPNRVIVEFYRTSDYATKVIPTFFSGPLLNAYCQSKLRAVEGRGQHLKSAKYFNEKWLTLKEVYTELLDTLKTSPSRTTFGLSSIDPRIYFPHLDISKFGIGVDEGE